LTEDAPLSQSLRTIVGGVLDIVDAYLPVNFASDKTELGHVFGVAAVRHAANLLAGERDLAIADHWPLTRLLGRALTEAWLWANVLLLGGDAAVPRLFGEDANHKYRLEKGRGRLWDRLESLRTDGVDLRGMTTVPSTGLRPDIAELARQARALREEHGLGGGIAEVAYEMIYRWESVHDVHVGLALLIRYVGDFSPEGATVRRQPGQEDVDAFRGPDALRHDAMLVADAVGVYLVAAGSAENLEHAKAMLSRLR
jgi:hypothetical protein